MKSFYILTLLISICFLGFGQKLHHQMLAAQGGNFKTTSGLIVRQSVGQMSATGNASVSGLSLQQGYQQSLISQIFPVNNLNLLSTTLYPNPFNGILNVSFSTPIASDLSVSLFNMLGVSLFTQSFNAPQSVLNFNFDTLPAGPYVIHVTAKNYSFSKTIIKL